MFRAMIADDFAALLELGERFHRWHENDAAALRCLDHVFTGLPKLLVASALEVTSSLHHFLLYVRLLQGFLSKVYSCDNEDIQRLVGFEAATEDLFLVPRETYLFSCCNHRSTPSLRPTDQGVLVLRWEIERLFKQILRARLHQKVVGENDLCRRLRSLQPCLAFVASGRCVRLEAGECPLEHLPAEAHNLELYNLRVRIVLQQILIYHTIYSIEHPAELSRQRR